MSEIEKHAVQIFDRKKRIIDQARQEYHLWEHHLFHKLILNGIPPPPWLSNSSLHSFPSDLKDLNRDDIVSDVLPSQTQSRVPFPGHQCSLYSNLDVVSDGVQYPIDLRDEVNDFTKDRNMGDKLSNFPDCSVNDAGCSSSGPPELDPGAISPQSQMKPRVLESCQDPSVSLVKLHRSRSRQKALELRNSAKVAKGLSGDGDNAGDCTATATGSASPSLQEDHIKELSLVNEFHPNSQSCLMEEVRRGDSLTQKDPRSNYTGRLTRSRSSFQKFNSLSVNSSSVEKEDDPPLNVLNEVMELVNQPSFINGNYGVQEPNIIEFRNKEVGSSVYNKRLTNSRSCSQAEYSGELLNLDSTSGRYKVVEASDLKQPYSHVELSKTSDCINGSRRNIVKDDDLCQNKEECNIQSRLRLHRSSCPSPGDHIFTTGGSVKSIDKSVQLPQPLKSKVLQNPSAAIVGSVGSQKEPHISALQTKENLSRSGSGKTYLTRNSKSLNSNSHEQSATHSESAGKKSQNVQPTEHDTRRLSSSPKYSKLEIEISSNSAEKVNIAEIVASRNTRAVPSCTKEGYLRPASSSNLDGASLLVDSLYVKGDVAEKDLDVQENIASDAKSTDKAEEHRSAATVANVHVDFGELVEKDPLCLGLRFTTDNPNVREDVSVLKLSSGFTMSVMPKQLVFDDGEETNRDGISSHYLKEGGRRMSPDKEPMALSEPLKLLDNDTQEVLAHSFSEAVTENGLHRDTNKSVTNSNADLGQQAPFGAPTDEVNVDLGQQAPHTISWGQNGDLSRQALLSNGKVTSFSTDLHDFKSSTECFINDVEHQQKRRKIEFETENFLLDSKHLLENLVDSIDQRPASGTLSIKEDNPESVIGVQHLAFHQADDIEYACVGNSPSYVIEDMGESQRMEGFSVKVRKEEKLILDERGRSSDTLMFAEANPFSFSVGSTRFTVEENEGSCHLQVNSGQGSEEHLTCVERSTSSRRIHPGGDTEFSDGLPVSLGEALPEFEGFLMQTDNVQPCPDPDQVELENMILPSNLVDYTSIGRPGFMHSTSCYSVTPNKLHSLPNLFQSLPNGLLEGYGLRTSRPLNDQSSRALSDCRSNCNGEFTSTVQTLWDRFNSNYGSSGKRKSSKPELPCINEENENVDEIAGTFQKGIGSEGMTGSINRGPLAEIVDNANPSTSVLQEAIASECEDFVTSEFNFDGTHNKVKQKPDKQDRNRTTFTGKGRGNQSISLGANGAKRNSESVSKKSSRPKLSGKDSMKQQRPTFSGGKSLRKNIVSNVTSFIPLVQKKQAAAIFTGKREDIKVKALGAAEAAKRAQEKKENDRKKKKELMELQKKKNEEERKMKEAEMTAKKRRREVEEKEEKERKRKCVNGMKQQEHGKKHSKKEESKVHQRATGEEVRESRKIMDDRDNYNNLVLQEKRQGNVEKFSETEPSTFRDSANNKTKESCFEKSESVSEYSNKGKETMVDLIKAVGDNDLIIRNSIQEQSYEMSPYRSDDEDDDEDSIPNKKFIPSWASKHSLSLIVSSQKMDPETIFPRQSFCDIEKVLLPQRLLL